MDFFRRFRQYDPMTLALVATTAVSAGASISGGISAQKSANQEADLQRQQGDIALSESKTNATNEAYNQSQAVGNQRLAFLANGVTLEGSPTEVLKQSTAYGQSQVDSILKQGVSQQSLAYQQAQITKNQGRAALIAGYGQAAGSVAGATGTLYKGGAFDTTKGPVTSKKAIS